MPQYLNPQLRENSIHNGGTQTNPGADTAIASMTIPAGSPGVYDIDVLFVATGTVAAANGRLSINGTPAINFIPTVASFPTSIRKRISLAGGDVVSLRNIAAEGAAVYQAFLNMTRVSS